ncbi:hypothetical protein FNJ84_17670 [Paracoccus sp. M683]|uniref:hypothetical protein n=1 Tax=Paracoccus sp. M683 TaxID=2594268 RepID=UPI00117D8B7C|nr:hypothetical protein [Paracoccus sp. M683]TRW94921.1 hypothetical protein FNJ84_17670 [Paracoccus sp. M683]
MAVIESIIRRAAGTIVKMDGTTYHFKDTGEHDGAHVTTVTNVNHAGRFLKHPEGYRLLGDDGSDFTAPNPSVQSSETPPIDPDTGDNMTALEGGDGSQTPALTVEIIDAMTDEELAEAYEQAEGRKPGNTKPETIRAKLKELIGAN